MAHKLDAMKAQRELAGHTITTLAKKANINDATIQGLENGGAQNVDLTQRIADALGVTLATLGKREHT